MNDLNTSKQLENTVDENKSELTAYIPFLIAALICIVVGGIYCWRFCVGKNWEINQATLGTLGDYFGGLLNPIVSICTLFVPAGVWRLQKIELAATKKALEDQASTLKQQNNQQRFFDMLRLYQDALNSLENTVIPATHNGAVFAISKKGVAAIRMMLNADVNKGVEET